jgi:arylsulfatase A-like enzyme
MERPNIVLIVIDTLRRDVVGCYEGAPPWGTDFARVQTPNLDRFAAQAIRFDRAFPEVLPTLPARRALYTGQRVFPFRRPDVSHKEVALWRTLVRGLDDDARPFSPGWGPIPEDQDTLAELFTDAGYRTGLVTDVYHQFGPSKNFSRGFHQWTFIRGQEADSCRSGPRPSADEIARHIPGELMRVRGFGPSSDLLAAVVRNFYDRHDEADWTSAQVFSAGADWLWQNRDARETGEGIFLTVECFDPHEMWFVPEHYRLLYDDSPGQDNVLSPYCELELDPALLRRTRSNYAGLVTMVDTWFGALLSALEDGGWLDDTLVAVVSDHGHSMLERRYMGKRGYPATPEVFTIPLLLRLPGARLGGTVSSGWVQHHDITATLLDFAGVTPAQPLDGRSVLRTVAGDAPQVRDHIVAGWGAGVLVATDEWWLSIKANGRGALLYPRGEANDPEAVSVAEAHPEAVEMLFGLALDEAGGTFPDLMLHAADREADAPGCSPVAAVPVL